MFWWIVLIVAVLIIAGWVVSRRRRGKERYRPDQSAINLAKKKDMGRW